MTTRDPLWNPNTRQPAGVEHWKTYLRDPLHGSVGDVLRSLFPDPCVLGTAWPVVYAAGKVDVSAVATRGAIVEDADGRSRLVRPTAALGAGEWFETLAGSAGFGDVWFPDVGGVTYYVSLRYELIPVQARTLGEPSTTGALAEYRFDVEQERIGRKGVPDLVTEPFAGQLQFRLDTLIGPSLWADNPAKTRQVVIWKVVPATGGAEAVALVDGVVSGGHFIATVPHLFGQSVASLTEADYGACVLGPVVETTNPAGDERHVLLATVTTGVVDYSTSNVVDIPEQVDDRLDEVEAWVRGYKNGPAQPYSPGAMLGNNADMGWNNIVLAEPGGGVVQAVFASSPFAVGTGVWLFVNGHFLFEAATGAPNWLDYQYSPAGAGTFTVCVEAVDETSGATAKWTGRLTTYAGTYGNAILAGLLPLVTYTWNGAAITAQAPLRLRAVRGEREHRSLGGDVLYLAPTTMASGTGSLALSVATGGTLKGTERLHLLADFDDDTAAATIAFERMLATLDGIDGHVLKVAAQANAAAQTTDTEFAALQLGGAGDLMLVGRSVGVGIVRQVAIADATNPLTKELLVAKADGGDADDQIPAASGLKPVLLAGDFQYLGANGKHEWQSVPLVALNGGRSYDNTGVPDKGHVFGPWVHGVQIAAGANPTGADPGDWLWLDIDNFGAGAGAEYANYGILGVGTYAELPISNRFGDYLYDALGYVVLAAGDLNSDDEITMKVVSRDVTGAYKEWARLQALTVDQRWFNDGALNAGFRSLSSHGETGADHPAGAGVAWVPETHAFQMLSWALASMPRFYLRFEISTWGVQRAVSVRGAAIAVKRLAP